MENLSQQESSKSNVEQMGESIIVALDWALSLEGEQVEVIEELFSYAAIEGDLSNKEIEVLYKQALGE